METLNYNCRVCKKETKQHIRKITDNLPPFVHAIECTGCGSMSIAKIGGSDE